MLNPINLQHLDYFILSATYLWLMQGSAQQPTIHQWQMTSTWTDKSFQNSTFKLLLLPWFYKCPVKISSWNESRIFWIIFCNQIIRPSLPWVRLTLLLSQNMARLCRSTFPMIHLLWCVWIKNWSQVIRVFACNTVETHVTAISNSPKKLHRFLQIHSIFKKC